jgi:hypothetical protein
MTTQTPSGILMVLLSGCRLIFQNTSDPNPDFTEEIFLMSINAPKLFTVRNKQFDNHEQIKRFWDCITMASK